MAISFLAAALSSVSPNAKKPTLLPSQSTRAFRSGVKGLNLYYIKF
jgi:hypothetical protein